MPKGLKRYYGQDHLHFLTCSCYHRQLWLASASRRDLFLQILDLQILEETRQRYGFVVAGYVVMPEHIHLLLSEPERGTPSTIMQVVKQRFARRVLGKKRNRAQTELLACNRRARMAAPLLRLQPLEREQTDREAGLHAPQSGPAQAG
jgi:REP element-mobilizing transposase RayT